VDSTFDWVENQDRDFDYPNIRMVSSALVADSTPQDDAVLEHGWIKSTAENAGTIRGY
jgi:hypothetical protein